MIHSCLVCVCVYVCLYVCMSVCLYVCMSVCLYVCMSVCMYVCICVCMCVYVCVSFYVCMYVCTCVRVYVCTCVRVYVCMCVCVYVCMYCRRHTFFLVGMTSMQPGFARISSESASDYVPDALISTQLEGCNFTVAHAQGELQRRLVKWLLVLRLSQPASNNKRTTFKWPP